MKFHNFSVDTSFWSLAIISIILLTWGLFIYLNFTLKISSITDSASKGLIVESLIRYINSENIFFRTKILVFGLILGFDNEIIFLSSDYFITLSLLCRLSASSYNKFDTVFSREICFDLGKILGLKDSDSLVASFPNLDRDNRSNTLQLFSCVCSFSFETGFIWGMVFNYSSYHLVISYFNSVSFRSFSNWYFSWS